MTPVLRRFLKACFHQIDEAENLRWYELKLYLVTEDMLVGVWLNHTSTKTRKDCPGVICPWYDHPGTNVNVQLYDLEDVRYYLDLEPISDNYAVAVRKLNRIFARLRLSATLERYAYEWGRRAPDGPAYPTITRQLIERLVYEGMFDEARERIEYFRANEDKSLISSHWDLDYRIICWNLIRACEVDLEEVRRRLIFRAEQNKAYFSLDEHLLSNRLLPHHKQSIPWFEEIQAHQARWLAGEPDS